MKEIKLHVGFTELTVKTKALHQFERSENSNMSCSIYGKCKKNWLLIHYTLDNIRQITKIMKKDSYFPQVAEWYKSNNYDLLNSSIAIK